MKILKFILALLMSFIPGVLGMHWTPTSAGSTWFAALSHPLLMPPSWMFSVIWTILYLLLAVAFYLVIKQKTESKSQLLAVELFIVHLILNASWSYVFFAQHLVELGAVIIVTLIMIGFMMHQAFKKINKRAGKLVIPYIVWLFCALYLNMGIYFLN